MHEMLLLFSGTLTEDPTKAVHLFSTKLLYLTPEYDPVRVFSTRLLYLVPEV